MTIKINYSKKTNIKTASNVVVFVNEKFNILNLKKHISSKEIIYIKDLLRSCDLKKNMFVFEVNSKRKIILISIKNDLNTSQMEGLGAELYTRINYGKNSEYFINSDTVLGKGDIFLGHFLHGLKLKSYKFNKYKTKKGKRIISINVQGNNNKPSVKTQLKFKSLEEGIFFTRDLVSEP
jgi:leucyl aminopeptidase